MVSLPIQRRHTPDHHELSLAQAGRSFSKLLYFLQKITSITMQLTSVLALSILGLSAATDAQRLSGYSYLDRRDYDHALTRRKFHFPSFGKHKPTEPRPEGNPPDTTSTSGSPSPGPDPNTPQASPSPVPPPAGSSSGTPPNPNPPNAPPTDPSSPPPPSASPGTPGNPSTPGAATAAPSTPGGAPGAPKKPHRISAKAKQLATSVLKKLKSDKLKVAANVAGKFVGVACDITHLATLIDQDSTALQEVGSGVDIGCMANDIIGIVSGGGMKRRTIAMEPWGLEVRDPKPWGLEVRSPEAEAWAWAEPDAYAWAYAEPEPEPEWSEDDLVLYARYLYGDEYDW